MPVPGAHLPLPRRAVRHAHEERDPLPAVPAHMRVAPAAVRSRHAPRAVQVLPRGVPRPWRPSTRARALVPRVRGRDSAPPSDPGRLLLAGV